MKKTLAMLAALFSFGCAHAQLGQTLSAASGASPAPHVLHQGSPWTTSSSTDAQGVTTQQFVNSAGTVFAVSWSGPVKPNLQQLLGSYFSQMPQGLGNVLQNSAGDLVVYSSGFMPHFQGYAYLKSQTPAGFTFPKN